MIARILFALLFAAYGFVLFLAGLCASPFRRKRKVYQI